MTQQIEPYDGPLDLLLEEVRRQRVAIERIAMAPIVARFLDYMRTAAQLNLALDIEWLHIAATLIEWKSRALLPASTDDQQPTDPIRDELVRQLLAYKKHAAADLASRQSAEDARFSRNPETVPIEAVPEPVIYVTVWDMMLQAQDLGRWVEEHREARNQLQTTWSVERDSVSVAEMSEYVRELLDRGEKLEGVALLMRQETPAHRACLFLGMLEMARAGECQLKQNELFGPIEIAKIRT